MNAAAPREHENLAAGYYGVDWKRIFGISESPQSRSPSVLKACKRRFPPLRRTAQMHQVGHMEPAIELKSQLPGRQQRCLTPAATILTNLPDERSAGQRVRPPRAKPYLQPTWAGHRTWLRAGEYGLVGPAVRRANTGDATTCYASGPCGWRRGRQQIDAPGAGRPRRFSTRLNHD